MSERDRRTRGWSGDCRTSSPPVLSRAASRGLLRRATPVGTRLAAGRSSDPHPILFVSYDIADPERLRKVHAVVKACAQRVQYSVYEALMTETERVLLEERLKRVVNQREDQVIFLDLGSAARAELAEI